MNEDGVMQKTERTGSSNGGEQAGRRMALVASAL